MSETDCRHCGHRIVCVNYLTGPAWTHQPAGASFQDGAHIYCHTTTAKPRPVGRRGLDAAEAEVEAATHLYGVAVVRAEAAEAKLAAVRELHRPDSSGGCRECTGDRQWPYPCPTIQALNGDPDA